MSERVAVRGLMAIAAREVSERAALLGLAAMLAVVPFVAPWIGIGDRPMLGGFLATVMVFTAALLTGSSVIARDLAEGRLGFFLARPVPWWSIWGGKMLAALVLTFAAGVIVLAPSALGSEWLLPAGGWWGMILAPGLVALIGIANALAVAYRARSAWFALDLALAAALGWLVARTSRTLMDWGAFPFEPGVLSAALWLLAAAVTIAGAAQFAEGRADIRRGHRVLSVVVWSLLTPAALAYAAWGVWVGRFAPADLRTVYSAWPSPNGSWIAVAGRTRWPRPEIFTPTVLMDAATQRFLRVGGAPSVRGPVFSEDVRRAVWVAEAWTDTPRLMAADLRSNPPSVSRVPLPVPPGSVVAVALSADGENVAVVQRSQAAVFKLGSAQALAVAPVRASWWRPIVFARDGRAHVLSGPADPLSPGVLDLTVLDPATGKAATTGHIPTRGYAFERWGADAARVAVVHSQARRPSLTLHDGSTGALIASLVPEGRAGGITVTFMRDGRLAVLEYGRGVVLRVFSTEGAESLSLEITPTFGFAEVAEVAPGVLAVELPIHGAAAGSDSVLVDVSAGRVIRREHGVKPAASSWFAPGAQAVPDAGGLFIDDRGALVRLDIATGARQILLGGS
ncbi:MAG TPA: hypothetical protein VFT38_00275 [Vicinamibacteria bacterium]|nr:hypothetical protein [Vicinamibacteria bacterium]